MTDEDLDLFNFQATFQLTYFADLTSSRFLNGYLIPPIIAVTSAAIKILTILNIFTEHSECC